VRPASGCRRSCLRTVAVAADVHNRAYEAPVHRLCAGLCLACAVIPAVAAAL
jgi:hypothetical protein